VATPVDPAPVALIEDLAQDGRGIARAAGKVMFIEGALPGERVQYRLVKRRAHFDEARIGKILEASPDRVEPRCAHFGLCGGCSLQHMDPQAQLLAKQRQLLDVLHRTGGAVPLKVLPPLQGPVWGYRRRARLGVKYVHRKQRVLAGFRERLSPYLADLSTCEVLVPALRTLPADLAALVGGMDLREQVPQVEVAVADACIALVFRVMAEPGERDLARLRAFALRQGVQVHLQTGGPDTVRPLDPVMPLEYRLLGENIRFQPTDFVQVNADINLRMVELALELLQPAAGHAVLDLFCGLGNFSLPLARRSRTLTGVEGDAGLIARARHNAEANGIFNARFVAQDLSRPDSFGPWATERHDRVLLDPPRTGAQAVVERMSRWGADRVVYISCHPGTLARDTRILVQDQGYELAAAGVMDMFPHTSHVESIAVFERRS